MSAFGGLFALLQDAGRLLYIGQNEWSHVNCALWSAEVFEEEDGSLKNVHVAVIRGKQLVGSMCDCREFSSALLSLATPGARELLCIAISVVGPRMSIFRKEKGFF